MPLHLAKAIADLYKELQELNHAIASLEELQTLQTLTPWATPRRRGRKFMSDEERQLVSERMRKYWASRREPTRP